MAEDMSGMAADINELTAERMVDFHNPDAAKAFLLMVDAVRNVLDMADAATQPVSSGLTVIATAIQAVALERYIRSHGTNDQYKLKHVTAGINEGFAEFGVMCREVIDHLKQLEQLESKLASMSAVGAH